MLTLFRYLVPLSDVNGTRYCQRGKNERLIGGASTSANACQEIKHGAWVHKLVVMVWGDVTPIAAPREVFRTADDTCYDRIEVDVTCRFQQL